MDIKNNFKKLYINDFINIFILLFFTFVTQFSSLNIEIINWDLGSFLTVSDEIQRGNLIYDQQAESKSPLLFYILSFLSTVLNRNFLFIKITFDILIFIISTLIYANSLFLTKSKLKALLTSLVFLSFLSIYPYGHSESWELFSIIFILSALYIQNKIIYTGRESYMSYFLIGIYLSCATLISTSTFIFSIPFFLFSFKHNKRNFLKYLSGLSLPWIIFWLIYLVNNLLLEFIYFNFLILFKYRSGNSEILNKTIDNFKILTFNQYEVANLFTIFMNIFNTLIILFSLYLVFNLMKKNYKDTNYQLVILSILFYIIAGKGYFHHLFFFFSFAPLIFNKIKNKKSFYFLITVLFLNICIFSFKNFENSLDNITRTNLMINEYPLYNFYRDNLDLIDENVLALNHPLLLFYFNSPNLKYYVHPTFENFTLSQKEKSLEQLLSIRPNVIICSESLLNKCKSLNGYSYNYTEFKTSYDYLYNYDVHLFKKSSKDK